MADNKRISLGNRVATPRVGNNPQTSSMSTEAAISRCIGARVRLTTTPPTSTTYDAYIYACAPSPFNTLTLTPTWPPPHLSPQLTYLPLSSIHSFNLLSLPKSAPQPIYPEEPTSLAFSVRASIDASQKAQARIGKGVSTEGQEIFDGISRTLSCKWDGKTIVVIDVVSIHPPYRPEDCRAPQKGQGYQVLARVRKVLENERKKIAEKNAGASVAAKGAPKAKDAGADAPAGEPGKGEQRKGG